MKIRSGFVSNSSSCGFIIPSKFLTEEQKEAILSCDDGETEKMWTLLEEKMGMKDPNKKAKPAYRRSEEYHKIKESMQKTDWDSWYIGEHDDVISGGTCMDNGYLQEFMQKIGIDISCVEWDGDNGMYKATNPEAIKFFINKHKQMLSELTDNDREFYKLMNKEHLIDELSIYEKDE